MSDQGFPVTVGVKRPDGTTEQVRVGTAIRTGDSFRLEMFNLSIGSQAVSTSAPPRPAASGAPAGGLVFPPYGRSKGAPIYGASIGDLEFYANGCRRTLADPAKSRFHDKEKALLAAIEAEVARQGGGSSDGPSDVFGPPGEEAE